MAWFRHRIRVVNQAVNYTSEVQNAQRTLRAVTMHWGAAPTTSENIVVQLDSEAGPEYDAVVYTLDPSADSTTDVLLTDINLPIMAGDAVRVTYANTDHNTLGIQVLLSDARS